MGFKDRITRSVRANLNDLLDRVSEFEREGGFRTVIDPIAETFGAKPPPFVPSKSQEKNLRDFYANLEVPYGSNMDTVKESYHRLMRKYHPDRHAASPEMEGLATELTQELTRAYQAIESYLTTGHY